jgi:hypothetical protein
MVGWLIKWTECGIGGENYEKPQRGYPFFGLSFGPVIFKVETGLMTTLPRRLVRQTMITMCVKMGKYIKKKKSHLFRNDTLKMANSITTVAGRGERNVMTEAVSSSETSVSTRQNDATYQKISSYALPS